MFTKTKNTQGYHFTVMLILIDFCTYLVSDVDVTTKSRKGQRPSGPFSDFLDPKTVMTFVRLGRGYSWDHLRSLRELSWGCLGRASYKFIGKILEKHVAVVPKR